MYYRITQELAQATLNYLTQKPYKEVAELVAAVLKMEPIQEPPEIKLVKKPEGMGAGKEPEGEEKSN